MRGAFPRALRCDLHDCQCQCSFDVAVALVCQVCDDANALLSYARDEAGVRLCYELDICQHCGDGSDVSDEN